MKRAVVFIFSLLLITLVGISCSKILNEAQSTGTLKLYLTDAFGNFERVDVTFSEIQAHVDGEWVTVRDDEPVTVNLLEWNNGNAFLLGDAELPAGHYTQIRLKILNASVTMDGMTYPVPVPSGAQSGLKILVNFDIEPGSTYELVLDFDAHRSIVMRGRFPNPLRFIFKPIIRAVPRAISGAITGTVTNPEHLPMAYAINADNDTVITSPVVHNGRFMLAFLPEGFYTVAIEDTLNQHFEKDSIQVTPGTLVDIGNITLQ